MNYGRFFALDLDASDIPHGIAVFNYHEVQNANRNTWCDEIHDTPQYPIYLQLTSEGVFFYLHYVKELNVDKAVHQDSLILSLSLSSDLDVRDNLTEAINRIYDTVFPLNLANDSIYDVTQESLTESPERICYSSLNVFNKEKRQSQGGRNTGQKPFNYRFIRKIFLDFLYDLEHSDVFENIILYDDIYIKLHKNFLFNAIANKAEYYYQRQQQLLFQKNPDCPWDMAEKKLFHAEYYAKAEQRWVETIANDKAERCFNDSQWFSDIESEMASVYVSQSETTRKKDRRTKNDYMECCNEYISKIIFPCHKPSSSKYKSAKDELTGIVTATAKTASDWYLKKYCFSGTLKIWYGRKYKWINAIIMSLVLCLCFIFLFPSFLNPICSNQVTLTLIIATAILFLWISGFINCRRWHIKTVSCINILMPRLFASIVAAWFTLAVGEDIFKGFFDIVHQKWVTCILLGILVVFVNYEIGKINPYIPFHKKIYRTTGFISVAFSYAFIVGVFVINFFGGKYLERSDYIDEFYANNVFTEAPEFKIPDDKQPQIVNDIFYETLEKYDSSIISDMVQISNKMPYSLSSKASSVEDLVLPVRANGNAGRINYGLTLRLLKEFVHNNRQPDMVKIHEKILEGSTIRSRVDSVCALCQRLNRYDISDFCNQHPLDSSFYRSAWCELLKSLDNHQIYRKVLKELAPTNSRRHKILKEYKFNILIFRDMLLQFTFFAMFIGIFIQLIVEEKPITKPV